jgi:hypothetical protein
MALISAPEVAEESGRHVVASPELARLLLAAVDELAPELTAFFGCLHYGRMRPGETVILRQADCVSKTSHLAAFCLLRGHLASWWQVLGSNQRKLSQGFYRPFPLAHRNGR